MTMKDKVHGEGNYEATRRYDEATKRFVESGQVDQAARAAKPKDTAEAHEMERAEQIGKSRAKEEDPALERGARTANREARSDAEAGESRGDPTTTSSPSPSAGQAGAPNEGHTPPEQSQAPMPGKE